jgi:hypothetical protein
MDDATGLESQLLFHLRLSLQEPTYLEIREINSDIKSYGHRVEILRIIRARRSQFIRRLRRENRDDMNSSGDI